MSDRAASSLPVERRRQARQWEWRLQVALAERLTELLDPSAVFWTSVDNQPWSLVSGIMRKKRGCRAGTPDVLLVHNAKVIGLELKSLGGKLSPAQKEVRLEMLRAGGMWVMVRTARGALTALHRLGVPFRRAWKPPRRLPGWEEPVFDPDQPTVWHPKVLRQWRADKRRARARQASRAAAQNPDRVKPKSPPGVATDARA